ncbi:MAG: hypothetical protein ACLGHN_13820 [Bacteriovoracia bacterium]
MEECIKQIESIFGTGAIVLEDSLPFSQDTINKHCSLNNDDKNTVISFSLENSRFPLNYLWQYLSHTQVQFCLQAWTDVHLQNFLGQNFWFNKNNISYSLFEEKEELAKDILLKSCLLLKKVSLPQFGPDTNNNFSQFSLAQISLLNFEDKIADEFLDVILKANELPLPNISEEDFLKGRYVLQKLKPGTSVLLRLLGIGGE